MIHCFKCGEDLPDNMIYCLQCGSRLDAEPETVVKPKYGKQFPPVPTRTEIVSTWLAETAKGTVVLIAVLCGVGIIVALLFAANSGKPAANNPAAVNNYVAPTESPKLTPPATIVKNTVAGSRPPKTKPTPIDYDKHWNELDQKFKREQARNAARAANWAAERMMSYNTNKPANK